MEGKRFGRWTVQKLDSIDSHRRKKYVCKCDCGTVKVVYMQSLTGGKSKSCGCYQKQRAVETHTKHGRIAQPTYNSWHTMKKRCKLKTDISYENYGGRGIKVCDRWESFVNFLADMGERPKGTTLDRINNDGNYERSNCRWSTLSKQAFNARPSRKNKLGVLGVRKIKQKNCIRYNARITVNGKEIKLYYGPSLDEAIAARKEAEKLYYNKGA